MSRSRLTRHGLPTDVLTLDAAILWISCESRPPMSPAMAAAEETCPPRLRRKAWMALLKLGRRMSKPITVRTMPEWSQWYDLYYD